MMKVTQMTGRTGAPVANQFIINDGEHEYFQSYETVIAKRHKSSRAVILDRDRWNYSVTTSKYRNQFLGMSTAQIKRDINAGLIELADLNSGGQS